MLAALADEDFNHHIVRGIRRVEPTVDIIRVQDTAVAEGDDATILAFAADSGRVLLTHDAKTIPAAAYRRVAKWQTMPGVVIVPQSTPIGRAIDDLVVLLLCAEPQELRDRVMRLPLQV